MWFRKTDLQWCFLLPRLKDLAQFGQSLTSCSWTHCTTACSCSRRFAASTGIPSKNYFKSESVFRIRIQLIPDQAFYAEYRFGSRNFMIKNCKQIHRWSKIAIYLSLGLHKGRPSYRRSPQSSKENFYSPGSRSTDLIEPGSNPDPYPKHWSESS
jgi:hypothetical protein